MNAMPEERRRSRKTELASALANPVPEMMTVSWFAGLEPRIRRSRKNSMSRLTKNRLVELL
jgi:hypothetical protein